MKTYQAIARKLNWQPTKNSEYEDQRAWQLNALEHMLPSGSGIDNGSIIDREKFSDNQFTITANYHHMDENGFYAGWYGFSIKVTTSLQWGIKLDIKLTYNDTDESKTWIKDNYFDYLVETYDYILKSEISDSDYHNLGMRNKS